MSSLQIRGEVRQRGSKPGRVILRRDAVGNVVGPDLHPGSGLTRRYFPGHGHRAGVPRFVGDEVHRLHNAHTWDEVKKTKQLIAVTVPHAAKCPTPGTSTLGRGRNAPVVGARSPGSAKHCACRPAPGPQEAPGRTPT